MFAFWCFICGIPFSVINCIIGHNIRKLSLLEDSIVEDNGEGGGGDGHGGDDDVGGGDIGGGDITSAEEISMLVVGFWFIHIVTTNVRSWTVS